MNNEYAKQNIGNEISLDSIKKIELEIMAFVHDFCQKNNIIYFLACGSLIGAVRHNGFIPWDDDIDIMMPREDYDRFIKTFDNDEYGVMTCADPSYIYSYAKAFSKKTIKVENFKASMFNLGIDVDIFPLDNVYSEDFYKKKYRQWKSNRIKWQMSVGFHYSSVVKRIIGLFGYLLFHGKTNKIARMMDLDSRTNSYGRPAIAYTTMTCVSDDIMLYDLEWFKTRTLHKFENKLFYIPSGYDGLLKYMYGDYMALPPESKRVTHHSYKAFWRKK